MSTVVKDITGLKFGNLTAIRFDHKVKSKHGTVHYWLFRCVCGKEVVCSKCNVLNGHTSSCGCLAIKRTIEANTRHGDSKNKLYFKFVYITPSFPLPGTVQNTDLSLYVEQFKDSVFNIIDV